VSPGSQNQSRLDKETNRQDWELILEHFQLHVGGIVEDLQKRLDCLQELIDGEVRVHIWQATQHAHDVTGRLDRLMSECQGNTSKLEAQEVRLSLARGNLENYEARLQAVADRFEEMRVSTSVTKSGTGQSQSTPSLVTSHVSHPPAARNISNKYSSFMDRTPLVSPLTMSTQKVPPVGSPIAATAEVGTMVTAQRGCSPGSLKLIGSLAEFASTHKARPSQPKALAQHLPKFPQLAGSPRVVKPLATPEASVVVAANNAAAQQDMRSENESGDVIESPGIEHRQKFAAAHLDASSLIERFADKTDNSPHTDNLSPV